MGGGWKRVRERQGEKERERQGEKVREKQRQGERSKRKGSGRLAKGWKVPTQLATVFLGDVWRR